MKFLPTCSIFVAATTLLLSQPCVAGDLRLPHVLTNHAVLQRDAPIHVWGWNTPSSVVTVSFHQQNVSAESNRYGEWSVYLMPEPKGGPYTLVVDGGAKDGKIELSDLLLGDIWIAGGQSNMELPLSGNLPQSSVKDSAREIASATSPRIRFLRLPLKSSDIPLEDIDSSWTECNPKTAAEFSAVAYLFGREISVGEDVPIGLIDAAWGGTPADAWVSLESLGRNPALHDSFANRADFARNQIHVQEEIAREKEEDAASEAVGKPLPAHPWHAPEQSWIPAGPYNGMIAPLTPLSIKGFLWYQGESDTGATRAPHYSTLFPALIEDWRQHFAQGHLPFLFVQISSYNSQGPGWATVRDAQRRTLYLRNTGMVVSTDVGEPDNIHPADKQTVAARLALDARAIAYGEPVPYDGPLFRQATTEQSSMRVWFDSAKGLTSHGRPLEGFEVAGDDRHFVPAIATIEGTTVKVTAASIPSPRFVRYNWNSVTPPALYNDLSLPASTFTSEYPAFIP